MLANALRWWRLVLARSFCPRAGFSQQKNLPRSFHHFSFILSSPILLLLPISLSYTQSPFSLFHGKGVVLRVTLLLHSIVSLLLSHSVVWQSACCHQLSSLAPPLIQQFQSSCTALHFLFCSSDPSQVDLWKSTSSTQILCNFTLFYTSRLTIVCWCGKIWY